jgi:hypothetical protein
MASFGMDIRPTHWLEIDCKQKLGTKIARSANKRWPGSIDFGLKFAYYCIASAAFSGLSSLCVCILYSALHNTFLCVQSYWFF